MNRFPRSKSTDVFTRFSPPVPTYVPPVQISVKDTYGANRFVQKSFQVNQKEVKEENFLDPIFETELLIKNSPYPSFDVATDPLTNKILVKIDSNKRLKDKVERLEDKVERLKE